MRQNENTVINGPIHLMIRVVSKYVLHADGHFPANVNVLNDVQCLYNVALLLHLFLYCEQFAVLHMTTVDYFT
jgi:hypothetical protein